MVDRAGIIPWAVGPEVDFFFFFNGASVALSMVQRSGNVVRASIYFRQPITVYTGLSVFQNKISMWYRNTEF